MALAIDSIHEKPALRPILQKAVSNGKNISALDLYSTSHEKEKRCVYDAPIVFVISASGFAEVKQSCCNHWDCPRCGQIRASQEYARIINGASILSERGFKLFFLTLTCRGRELSLKDAEINYYTWTNKLLNSCRDRSKKQKMPFHYAQVTERQERGHPHSHLISTFCPDDAVPTRTVDRAGKQMDVLISHWFIKRNVSAGLGNQCQIQEIRNAVGMASYVAKYLFKSSISTVWPPKWKRVRYSQQYPKLLVEKPELSFPLFRVSDWRKMDDIGLQVYTDTDLFAEMGKARGLSCIRLVESLSAQKELMDDDAL